MGDTRVDLEVTTVEKEFHHYWNEETQVIDLFGLERLGEDLGIDMENDVVVLILAYLMNSTRMYQITREEWLRLYSTLSYGFLMSGIQSINELREMLPDLRQQYKQYGELKKLYNYLFGYITQSQVLDKKHVSSEVFTYYIDLLFDESMFKYKIEFKSYILENQISVNKDQWKMFYLFIEQYGRDLSTYNLHSFWPTYLDEFVKSQRCL